MKYAGNNRRQSIKLLIMGLLGMLTNKAGGRPSPAYKKEAARLDQPIGR